MFQLRQDGTITASMTRLSVEASTDRCFPLHVARFAHEKNTRIFSAVPPEHRLPLFQNEHK